MESEVVAMDMTPVRVGAFQTHPQAHAARGYLHGHGIDATVVADDSHGLDPEIAFGTSRVTLLIPPDQAREARRLLNEMEPSGVSGRRWGEVVVAGLVLTVILVIVAVMFAMGPAGSYLFGE